MGALLLIGLFLIPAAAAQQPAEPQLGAPQPPSVPSALIGEYQCEFRAADPHAPRLAAPPHRFTIVLREDGTWWQSDASDIAQRRYFYREDGDSAVRPEARQPRRREVVLITRLGDYEVRRVLRVEPGRGDRPLELLDPEMFPEPFRGDFYYPLGPRRSLQTHGLACTRETSEEPHVM